MASLPLQSLAEYRRFVAETLQHPCVLHSTVRVWSDMHNTSEVLFRLCANTDPQRDSIFTKGPADVLDHTTSEIAIGSKLGVTPALRRETSGKMRLALRGAIPVC